MANKFEPMREVLDLSGFWSFKVDPEQIGEEEGGHSLSTSITDWDKLYVPADWNGQCSDHMIHGYSLVCSGFLCPPMTGRERRLR